MCKEEFGTAPFNGKTYKSQWKVPTSHIADAESLMAGFAGDLQEPAVGAPSPEYSGAGSLSEPTQNDTPAIHLDGAGAMPAFHPILTTDYFEYGTTANRLDQKGAAVEMGDAALGLACEELRRAKITPPKWAAVRNMSDPVIEGELPAKQFHLNEQTTWAVAFYTGYGRYTSIMSSLAAWAIIAGL
jgi:hypothetical protein